MPDHDWNEHYASGQMPWDSDEPDPALVAPVEAGTIPAGRTLEVGCGTGTNALWLAAHGFDVLGLDVSTLAIDRACRFEVLDFLKDPPTSTPISKCRRPRGYASHACAPFRPSRRRARELASLNWLASPKMLLFVSMSRIGNARSTLRRDPFTCRRWSLRRFSGRALTIGSRPT